MKLNVKQVLSFLKNQGHTVVSDTGEELNPEQIATAAQSSEAQSQETAEGDSDLTREVVAQMISEEIDKVTNRFDAFQAENLTAMQAIQSSLTDITNHLNEAGEKQVETAAEQESVLQNMAKEILAMKLKPSGSGLVSNGDLAIKTEGAKSKKSHLKAGELKWLGDQVAKGKISPEKFKEMSGTEYEGSL